MKKMSEAGYNERLFTKGFRGRIHSARFLWVVKSLLRYQCEYKSIIELGCFDGKIIEFLPNKPQRYLGLDANVEGGLDIAAEKWGGQSNYVFRKCTTPTEMEMSGEKYDVSICMETLEHIPPQLVDPYLKELAKATKSYIFITVPNELGIVFLAKYIVKKIFGDSRPYTLGEIFNETLGRTDKVERNEHKGFNYNKLIAQVANHFDIVEVSGHPIISKPTSLSYGIGIVGRSKY